MAKSIN